MRAWRERAPHEWDEPAETLLTTAQTIGARVPTPIIGRPFEPARGAAPPAHSSGAGGCLTLA